MNRDSSSGGHYDPQLADSFHKNYANPQKQYINKKIVENIVGDDFAEVDAATLKMRLLQFMENYSQLAFIIFRILDILYFQCSNSTVSIIIKLVFLLFGLSHRASTFSSQIEKQIMGVHNRLIHVGSSSIDYLPPKNITETEKPHAS